MILLHMAQKIKVSSSCNGEVFFFPVSTITLDLLADRFKLDPCSVYVAPLYYPFWDKGKHHPHEGEPIFASSDAEIDVDWNISDNWAIGGELVDYACNSKIIQSYSDNQESTDLCDIQLLF
jgi:hypothetical protein